MSGLETAAGTGGRAMAGQLAGGLREVAQRASGLTQSQRRRALEIYLAYQLGGQDRQQVPALLRETLDRFDPTRRAVSTREGAREAVAGAAEMGENPPGDDSANALEELAAKIRSLAGADADPTATLGVLLDQIQTRGEAVERSVKQTAQEFFDRLMQALDPDAARAFVGKPGLRPSPLYKAAVFDAYAEKFSQLAEYHRKGRLVRDFRASFKRNLRG